MIAICSSIDLRKPSSGLHLVAGVAVLDLGLGDVGLGVVEVVLEQRLGLLLEAVDERLGDVLLEHLQIGLVQGVLEELEVLLLGVVGEVGLLDHADQRLADADRVDRALVVGSARCRAPS